jgi:hypothetical protein
VQALVDVDLLQRDVMPLQPAEVGWNAIATPVVEGALGIAETKDVTLAPRGDLAARVACDAVLVQRNGRLRLSSTAIANAPGERAPSTSRACGVDGRDAPQSAVRAPRPRGRQLQRSTSLHETLPSPHLPACRDPSMARRCARVSPVLEHGIGLGVRTRSCPSRALRAASAWGAVGDHAPWAHLRRVRFPST